MSKNVPQLNRDVIVMQTGGCMASPSVSSEEPWTYSVYVGTELRLADRPLFEAKQFAARLASAANRPAWLTVVSGEYVPLG